MISSGLLVEIGQMYAHWNNWFDAAKGVIDTVPEMPVQGNHEHINRKIMIQLNQKIL